MKKDSYINLRIRESIPDQIRNEQVSNMRDCIIIYMSDKKVDFLEKGITFKRKPAKMGDRYIFSIPSLYIENGLIDPDQTYIIYLAEAKEGEEED